MDVCVLAEDPKLDQRVPLTPGASRGLARAGNRVFIQQGAGEPSQYSDADYQAAEATVVYGREEALARGDVVVMLKPPTLDELSLVAEGATLISLLHLSLHSPEYLDTVLARDLTAVSMELIADHEGRRPCLMAISEIAGVLAIQVASHYLQSPVGGRGILLGGAPGVPPGTVLVVGAGTVGLAAAATAQRVGANTMLFDREVRNLRRSQELLGPGVATNILSRHSLERLLVAADALIGAVSVAGERAPVVITAEQVAMMRPGAVIVDLSIDEGGCVETSHPTTITSPTFAISGVTHFCVPNLTTLVARSASRAISHALFPYIEALGRHGPERVREVEDLARGTCTCRGQVTHPEVARHFEREYRPLQLTAAEGER
jgi:alanine dehydrogenase